MKRCLIECGVPQASEADALAMNVSEPGKNVNLRIDYISRSMIGNIPDLLIDLLEVAAYVYCADQRIARGSAMLTNFGEDWRRSLTFSIPVRHPEVWQRTDVQELLLETLGFLSDDSYEFSFRKAEAPVQPRELYFPELLDAFQENDEVSLFSGGVDSFAGAVNDIVTLGKSVNRLSMHCEQSPQCFCLTVQLRGRVQLTVAASMSAIPASAIFLVTSFLVSH